MNSFELFFLNFGFSWTISKILPYVLFLIIGGLISFYLFKRTSRKKKLFIATPLSILPFIVFFILFPIYEGDFSNSPYSPDTKFIKELSGADLVVIAIPGCPFCLESARKINLLKSRNPEIEIRFVVCTTRDEDLLVYRKAFHKSISVEKTIENDLFLEVARNGFPTFVSLQHGEIKKAWSNDAFGVRAIDEVESNY
jgi:hypothetical protein